GDERGGARKQETEFWDRFCERVKTARITNRGASMGISKGMKVAMVSLAGVLAGLGSEAQAQTPTHPAVATAGQGTAAKKQPAAASAYDRALLKPALLKANAPEEYKVKFVTTRGEFTLTVHRAWAPLGADRFYNLLRHHFFDNASIF